MRNFASCVVFEVDGAAFEAHVDVWQLLEEQGVYLAAHGGAAGLASLLARQLVNEGSTRGGLRFSRAGGRASGDFNTGMGNTLIMLAVVVAVMKSLQIPFDLLVDGDNALVFMSQCDSARVVSCFSDLALQFSGHEMVLERPVTRVEDVRFGQCAPVEVRTGVWMMVRDWTKVISQMTSSHAHLNHVAFVRPYLRGVAWCEMALNRGVPVIQAYARHLLALTVGAKAVDASFYRDYEALGVDVANRERTIFEEPTAVARDSFSLAFGVTPDEQLDLERALCNTVLRLDKCWRPEESPWHMGLADARPGLVDQFLGVRQ